LITPQRSPAGTRRARVRRKTLVALLWFWLDAVAPAASPGVVLQAAAERAVAPERPSSCREVTAGADLAALLAAAVPGEALCLAPGDYAGPLRLGPRVTLWGPRDAVVHSSGEGTTVRLEADGAALLGLTVDGSGGRYDLLDAAVHVQAADVRVEGVLVRRAVYGILVEKSARALVCGNEVVGDASQTLGLRGDGIRLWETRDSLLEHNVVRDGRDLVVWYSSRNRIVGNRVERSRYGTHLMYSHDVEIESNEYVSNITGVFLMYSRGTRMRRNLLAGSTGAAGIGLGLKESDALLVAENHFVHNTVGIYVDTSPLNKAEPNLFESNVLRLGEVGISFLGGAEGNAFRDNELRDNQDAVRVEGRGDALGAEWRGNDFDDYAGYDLDGDGIGDVPYELRSLSSDLISATPVLAFFRGTPALGFAEAIGRSVPLFETRLLLVDPVPRVRPLSRRLSNEGPGGPRCGLR